MQLKIIKGDITKIECDAIVSSASSDLIPSGAIDTAIHKAAGGELAKACYKFKGCKVGSCVITRAYDLPCYYVIHAVAPYAAHTSAVQLLTDCYQISIETAIEKECTSIAFPLMGSGHKGFSAKQALSIALKAIDACMQDKDYKSKLLIYLVVYSDEKFALAMSMAQSMIMPNDILNDSVPGTDGESYTGTNHWISLCRINKPDKNEQIWMQRIADLQDGTLVAPIFDSTKEQIFDNRPLLFHENGPVEPECIGFWEWSENQNDFGNWRSKSTYIEHLSPVEIVLLENHTEVEEVVSTLKNGLHIPAYLQGTILFAVKKLSFIEGVLCNFSNFNTRPGNDVYIKLKDDIWTLPCCRFSDDDIFIWKNRKICKKVELGEATRRIPVRMPTETIKQLFLQRMTWPVFKAQGVSKSDWQKFMQFINAIPEASIQEKLSETYGLSVQDAQSSIAAFLQKVESYIQAEDVDAELIVQMLNSHKSLKWMCEALAAQKWQEEHKAEIEQAHKEIDELRAQTDAEMEKAELQLAAVEKAIASAEETHKSVLQEIASAESKLDKLLAEIDEYESIGKSSVEAIRQKIADAQKDVSGFIADLSVFLPQSNVSTVIEKKSSSWQYESAPYGVYPENETDSAVSWKDELNALNQNFAQPLGMTPEFSAMLSAFVYAAYINNMPLLIAGPGGEDIAEILSVALHGCGAGRLTLGNEYDCAIADEMAKREEAVVSVRNMFGKGWSDTLPQAFRKLKKQVVWTHPYVEDMAIEPKGLYNYMLPIFSECFIGAFSEIDPWPGKCAEKFVPFVPQKKKRLRIAAFEQLKLSKLLLVQLEKVLSDARELMNNPNADKDVEILFGLIPLCVLTGRTDVLKEVIETETGISSPVKAEAARYIEEA